MVGSICDDHFMCELKDYVYECDSDNSIECAVLDGLILMTQYDLPWRTDVFDKWHFYDISQCMEFRKVGLKAAVLPQSEPLVIHRPGMSKMEGYDEERAKFQMVYEGLNLYRL